VIDDGFTGGHSGVAFWGGILGWHSGVAFGAQHSWRSTSGVAFGAQHFGGRTAACSAPHFRSRMQCTALRGPHFGGRRTPWGIWQHVAINSYLNVIPTWVCRKNSATFLSLFVNPRGYRKYHPVSYGGSDTPRHIPAAILLYPRFEGVPPHLRP
jgi:hypothetical protein